jgi:hypothetical protein
MKRGSGFPETRAHSHFPKRTNLSPRFHCIDVSKQLNSRRRFRHISCPDRRRTLCAPDLCLAVAAWIGELEKLTPAFPSLPASLNCEKTGLKGDNSDQTDLPKKTAGIIPNDYARATLTEVVPPLKNLKLAERGGFEPPIRLLTV